MVLNERKLKILQAIITDYIATAEPIGSRTIAKKFDIGLSSATIRNEMSDLEEMGLIIQPHTSAGRIPSDKGYRLYVDTLMNLKTLSDASHDFLYETIMSNIENIDNLMKETAKAISYLTKYTAIATEPLARKTIIKHVQLVPVDDTSIVMVLVTNPKNVGNFHLKINTYIDNDMLLSMSVLLNKLLAGKSQLEIDRNYILSCLDVAGQEGQLLKDLLDDILKNILKETEIDIYTRGVRNILSFPEFSDLNRAKSVFQALEERDILITLLDNEEAKNINIVIGQENSIEQMKNCSIIKAGFYIKNNFYTSIGILGPTRMDYAQVISVLSGIENILKNVIRGISNDP